MADKLVADIFANEYIEKRVKQHVKGVKKGGDQVYIMTTQEGEQNTRNSVQNDERKHHNEGRENSLAPETWSHRSPTVIGGVFSAFTEFDVQITVNKNKLYNQYALPKNLIDMRDQIIYHVFRDTQVECNGNQTDIQQGEEPACDTDVLFLGFERGSFVRHMEVDLQETL